MAGEPGDIMISVESVSKDFILPHERTTSIKSGALNVLKKKSKGKEQQHALKDISFEVKTGEFFGIVGRNGSGKSTLLKILAEIYQPTKGKVSVKGKLVPFIELGVGFNPELTGRENVYLNGALLGFSKKQIDEKYDDIVQFAELEKFMDQKLKNYSSGMQVRLAFSVATRSEADILLVDEVLAVGDADFQRKCYDFFKSLKKSKTTVVFISHDMNAIREFCDRVALIDNSQMRAIGRPDKIAQDYSRLFTSESGSASSANTIENRWGDGRVEITKIKLNKKIYTDDDDTIEVSVTFTAKEDYDGLVSGIGIKDTAGNNIYGTNTQIKKIKIPKLSIGETCTLTWYLPNILADGSHSLDITLHDSTAMNIYDWRESVIGFSVRREERTLYPITPKITASVNIDK